ncbi:hypothetical protein YTPLAS18_24670 [Nitrospira sp.]|nr:hypothetical protein YTPLAS18_24670 [Nitrospira sp.]
MIKRNRGRADLGRQQQVWEWGLLLGGIIVVLLVVSFFFDDMGFPRYWNLRHQVSQLEQEIDDLRRGNARMKLEVDRLRHDPERLEELAREQLGFVRKGETVYQLAPPAPPAAETKAGVQ